MTTMISNAPKQVPLEPLYINLGDTPALWTATRLNETSVRETKNNPRVLTTRPPARSYMRG